MTLPGVARAPMQAITPIAARTVTVSVVSHLHGEQIMQLLCKLEALCHLHVGHVVVTINVPEPALVARIQSRPWAFELTLLQNPLPKGFGANHNAAFGHNKLDYFGVLNPDIDFEADPFTDLIAKLADPLAGCSFPIQLDMAGQLQDHARNTPSPAALLERYKLFGAAPQPQRPSKPDWVNGAFMLFRAGLFKQLGGFDQRYFMYCEDVDICFRLQLAGYALSRSEAKVTHAASRSSRGNVTHLAWHVLSLLRLWTSASYRNFSRFKQKQ